jgi:hypothetical protein
MSTIIVAAEHIGLKQATVSPVASRRLAMCFSRPLYIAATSVLKNQIAALKRQKPT